MTDTFTPGDPIVHAVHGPGTILAVERRDVAGGGAAEYVSIDVDGMTVKVPLDQVDAIGLRDPIVPEEAEQVLDLLADDPLEDPGHSRRRRRNRTRLAKGDATSLAKVVRSLRALRRRRDTPLAYRDKRHLQQASERLASELALALNVDRPAAEEMIEDATSHTTGASGR